MDYARFDIEYKKWKNRRERVALIIEGAISLVVLTGWFILVTFGLALLQ